MKPTWLDGQIGWNRDFNKIETIMPTDPAVDAVASNFEEYYSNNFDSSHLVLKDGAEPVAVEINLPTAGQWASILELMKEFAESGDDSLAHIACVQLFEMCVRFRGVDSAKPKFRRGTMRLPEEFVTNLASGDHLWFIEAVGGWIIAKCMLGQEEKKQ